MAEEVKGQVTIGLINLNKEPAKGYNSPWLTWRCLKRLSTGYNCSKKQRKKWGYFNGDTTCACGMDAESTAHMLRCSPVWARSTYADILDPELSKACRAITGCFKQTNVEELYLLVGIVPPNIRRYVGARIERIKQMEQGTHSLFGHIPARSRLKSRKDFLTSVKPSYLLSKVVRCNEWQRRSRDKSRLGMINLNKEQPRGIIAPGSHGDA